MPVKTAKPAAEGAAPKKRKAPQKKETTVAAVSEPSREDIARLAEKYWAERGWPEGSPEQDWLRAEQELKSAS